MYPEINHDHSRDRREFEKYQETKQEFENEIDSPMDSLLENISERAREYSKSCGIDAYASPSFAKVVSAIARAALTIEAISGLIVGYVEEQVTTIRIKTVLAILSLVKDEKPHLQIDVIEHAFGLSRDKESEIARKHGVDRQVVSKRVVKLRNTFGLTSERKKQTIEIYRDNRLHQYERARGRLRDLLSGNNAI